jgi:aldehyde:ferredoxin oxidoreductase
MIDEYYRARGWHVENGHPRVEKLRDLGLEKDMLRLKAYSN